VRVKGTGRDHLKVVVGDRCKTTSQGSKQNLNQQGGEKGGGNKEERFIRNEKGITGRPFRHGAVPAAQRINKKNEALKEKS